MENWTSVFTTTVEYTAEEVKCLLEQEGIPAVILNHKDSAYVMLGEINVMVNKDDAERAACVIEANRGE
ncbi:MAG: DUF2007 domain-containing protein [Odoribacteraceae bacterium]|jgi:hypothetical protein|nr:DUF2007 domain-containing protein [Odoribacteraceae bacterium]